MSHSIIAALLMIFGIAIGHFIPTPFLVAIGVSYILFMREVTQAEYRWITAHGGLRSKMQWWKGMDVRLWDYHSLGANFLIPSAISFCLATIYFIVM